MSADPTMERELRAYIALVKLKAERYKEAVEDFRKAKETGSMEEVEGIGIAWAMALRLSEQEEEANPNPNPNPN